MTTTAYTGRATNWTMVAVSGLLLVPLIGLASSDVDRAFVLVVGLALLGVLAEVVTASDVRVACGTQGVSVHWGALGWPRASYPLDQIEDVSVVHVPWWAVSFGFWWTPWRTVCTVRSGPALRLRLRNGRRVTITVPDPAAAATALRSVS
ncbi:hypothetical protein BJ993_001773 [Nocardioides aromaticivorans]|uniref:Uncharacterized protein n=1 Tax=Nocardioides aromaticivorans TaxID=200618 RepID=A0A7Y9ZI14_9ACTN|nr:hypothetical protein [Nocardioides aromaticivorans]NYI44693.1 hypothetical protein [Nocardioides aromaticivorans]